MTGFFKTIGIFIFIFLTTFLWSEEKIRVYKPLTGGKYNRTVTLKPVLEIKDEGGKFLFQHPYQLKVAKNGNIFILDGKSLFQFTNRGKFLRNIIKTGEGPGEVPGQFAYYVQNNKVMLFAFWINKLIWIDLNGHMIEEKRITSLKRDMILETIKDQFLTIPQDQPESIAYGINTIQNKICLFNPQSGIRKVIVTIPIRLIKVKHYTVSWDHLKYVIFQDDLMIFNHKSEYGIKLIDIQKGKLISCVSRKFKRIPSPEKSRKHWKNVTNGLSSGLNKFLPDITNLFLFNSKIWVFVTTEKEKDQEVDVYNLKGEYIDHFYLKLTGKVLNIQKGHIYVRVPGDETITIQKCLPVGL